jgi:hypothetical protein
MVALACAGDDPVASRPSDGRGSAEDAGAPADAAGPARPVPDLDARVALPVEPARPAGDAATSGPLGDAATNRPVGDAAVGQPGAPAASDAAVPDAGAPGKVCDAKVGPCDPATQVSCDARTGMVTCKRAPPSCPQGQVPAVVDSCWGECVPIEQCVCTEADACPERETYVCHMGARRCGPYVN